MVGSGPIVKEPTPEQDRVRPLPLVGVALGSLVAGFLIVYALGESAADAPGARPTAARPPRETPDAAAQPPAPAPPAADDDDATPAAPTADAPAPEATPNAAAAPSESAPEAEAAPSARGSTVGDAFYFRCWEAGHDDPAEGSCDRLPELERRIAAQLPAIEACASGAQGTLSLGVEVQLRARQATFWAGRRSTITPVEPLIRCVRTRLADTNLDGLEGRFRKYTLFVPIDLR